MAELSVGYTAGLIALGIVIAQLWLPTVLSFLLAGVLRDEETAASWTVAAKILQSSHWTTILRSDSARGHAVRTPIFLTSLAIPIATVLTAIAGVVTPLGLYEEREMGGREVGNFSYVRDTSAYFDGTSPRGNYPFSRMCFFRGGPGSLANPGPCPYTNDTLIFSQNSMTTSWDYPDGLNTSIPPILREIYSSGTRGIGTTVSNFFDIEWRQLTMESDERGIINNGSAYAISMFRQLDSVALEDSIRLVEGLIVDTRSGGVGFRNHTVPQPPDRNVTWQEDLLFIEPVTACVDTNLTIDYTESERNLSAYNPPDYRLTDRGGFVNLNHTYPYYDLENPQQNPDLWGRAYKAAMIHNFYAMIYMNVTNPGNASTGVKAFQYVNSTAGKSFPLSVDFLANYRAASFSGKFGSYLLGSGATEGKPIYPNPFNVTERGWFDRIRLICSGAGSDDVANITNIFVTCGLLRGAPRRVDGGPQGIFEHGSRWSSPLYSCASAVRATIKTVDFTTDLGSSSSRGSGNNNNNNNDNPAVETTTKPHGLASFRVTNITAKTYPSPDAYPVWGVEDTGRPLGDIRPIWGLVSPAYHQQGFPNISTVKQPSLYLIGLGSGVLNIELSHTLRGSQNLPGAEFPFAAANTIFGSSPTGGVTHNSWPFDLVGRADMAVFTRWQALCASGGAGAARVVNLIWTDLAASAVVGTKGISTSAAASGSGGGESPPPVIHVRATLRRTKYHFAYGIPAFALLVALVVLSVGALCAWLSRMSSVERVRMRIQQLSAGRIFTIVLYPGDSDFKMSPRQWSLMSGGKTVRFADGVGGIEEVQTPGGYPTDIGEDVKVEIVEDNMGAVPEHKAPQRGGYIALGPMGYEDAR